MLQASRFSSEFLVLQGRLLQPLGHRRLCLLWPQGRVNESQIGTCFEAIGTIFGPVGQHYELLSGAELQIPHVRACGLANAALLSLLRHSVACQTATI